MRLDPINSVRNFPRVDRIRPAGSGDRKAADGGIRKKVPQAKGANAARGLAGLAKFLDSAPRRAVERSPRLSPYLIGAMAEPQTVPGAPVSEIPPAEMNSKRAFCLKPRADFTVLQNSAGRDPVEVARRDNGALLRVFAGNAPIFA